MAFSTESAPFERALADRLVRKWLGQVGGWSEDSASVSAAIPVYDIVLAGDSSDDGLVLASWRCFAFGEGQHTVAIDFINDAEATIHRSCSGPRVENFVVLAMQADARAAGGNYACRLIEADLCKLAAAWLFGNEELFFVAASAERAASRSDPSDREGLMQLARQRFARL